MCRRGADRVAAAAGVDHARFRGRIDWNLPSVYPHAESLKRPSDQTTSRALPALLAGLALIPAASAPAQEGEPRKHFVLDSIRVLYSVAGPSAVDPEDRDGNNVPDQVENVARQVWAARELFVRELGFPDPYGSERFGKVDCVQVSLHSKATLGGRNGLAYRLPQRAHPIPEGMRDDRALILSVATEIDPTKNVTPAHEFFHLVQYGATYLSNGWFLEGLARWSESAWRDEDPPITALALLRRWPHSERDLETLFSMRYEAGAYFWNPIGIEAETKEPTGEPKLPVALASLTYTDGTPVLRGSLPPGIGVMREILAELALIDDRVKAELGYEEWTLAHQGAPGNSPHLYEAVGKALHRRGLVRKAE